MQTENKKTFGILACSFLLPCVLLLTVLAVSGIYPFGEKSLLIIDMNSEYVDYLAQMNEAWHTGGSLLRSWNMGMGLNMLGLIAFYTASPFNLLVILLPVELITEMLLVVTLLKIGLAGLCFADFARYVFRLPGLPVVCFACAYALCGYNIAYASNIMWLDGVALLPLVLLGVERLLRSGHWGTLLAGYVYVFFTSYYIGYMVGGFSLLYLTAVWFSRPRGWRPYLQKLGRLLGAAALAAGLCAFLLLPAFLNLRSGQDAMWSLDILSAELERPFVRILSRLLPGAYDSLTDSGYPNIYCSVLALLLATCYFCHKKIPRREKMVFGGLLFFLLLSFSCRLLDLGWHAFEDPTWYPARYSFVFCFLILYLAMRTLSAAQPLPSAGMAGALVILLLLLIEIGVGQYRHIALGSLLAGAVLLLCYGLLWRLWRPGRHWVPALALLLCCAELWLNALVMERGLDEQFGYKSRAEYTAYRETWAPAVAAVAAREPSEAYRLEILEQRSANGGMMLGYNGVSHYSTTTDQALNAFLRRLGYNRGTENELRFSKNTPLTGGFLGIKYLLARESPNGGYSLQGRAGDIGIYENSCAFPLAFWAPAAALDFCSGTDDPFVLQNELLAALGYEGEFFAPLAEFEGVMHNLNCEQVEGVTLYAPRVSGQRAAADFTLHNPQQQEVYAYFPVWERRFSGADVWVDGVPLGQELRYRKNTVLPLGSGSEISLTLDFTGGTAYLAEQYFYTLDLDAARTAAAAAQENALQITHFSDTQVQGSLSAPRDGALVTTFPYDEGWRVWLDGERVQPQRFAGVFLALPVGEGTHSLQMSYCPPGFQVGCTISAVCLSGLLLGWLFWRKKHD